MALDFEKNSNFLHQLREFSWKKPSASFFQVTFWKFWSPKNRSLKPWNGHFKNTQRPVTGKTLQPFGENELRCLQAQWCHCPWRDLPSKHLLYLCQATSTGRGYLSHLQGLGDPDGGWGRPLMSFFWGGNHYEKKIEKRGIEIEGGSSGVWKSVLFFFGGGTIWAEENCQHLGM